MSTSGAHDPIYVFSNVSWSLNIWRCSSKDDKSMLTSLSFCGISMIMNMEQKDTACFNLDICLSSFLYLPATKAECIFNSDTLAFINTCTSCFFYPSGIKLHKFALIIWRNKSHGQIHTPIWSLAQLIGSFSMITYVQYFFIFFILVHFKHVWKDI